MQRKITAPFQASDTVLHPAVQRLQDDDRNVAIVDLVSQLKLEKQKPDCQRDAKLLFA